MIFRLLSYVGAAKRISKVPVVAGAVAGVGDLVNSVFKVGNDTLGTVPAAINDTPFLRPSQGGMPSSAASAAQQAAPYAQQAAQAAKPITDPFVQAAAPSLAPAVGDDLLGRAKANWPILAAVGGGLAALGIAVAKKGR